MRKILTLLLLLVLACSLPAASTAQKSTRRTQKPTSGATSRSRTNSRDDAIGRAFATRTSYVQVEGEGTVLRLLADDTDGSRHQRFIVELASGQTLLMVHNIDVAPRVDGLAPGDRVGFKGEYIWNEKGGVVHWTHHDPEGRHAAGWIVYNGRKYQ